MIALQLSNIIIIIITKLNPSPSASVTVNWLETGGLFATVGTTSITTLLIIYRIHTVSSRNGLLRLRNRYAHIFDLLIQSAALYVFGLLFFTITLLVPINPKSILGVLNGQFYAWGMFPFVAVRSSPTRRIVTDDL